MSSTFSRLLDSNTAKLQLWENQKHRTTEPDSIHLVETSEVTFRGGKIFLLLLIPWHKKKTTLKVLAYVFAMSCNAITLKNVENSHHIDLHKKSSFCDTYIASRCTSNLR